MKRLLAVGEDPSAFRELARHARAEGTALYRVQSPAAALRAIAREEFGLIFVSLNAGGLDQLQWWEKSLPNGTRSPRVVAMVSDPALALEVARLGPFEMLSHPVDHERFSDLLRRVNDAETEAVIPLLDPVPPSNDPYPFITQSPEMLSVFRTIAQVAPTNANVLITGESGTGKELVARMIHQIGPRADAPFVALNCAAIPEHLLESELFGHEKGSFTGAVSQKAGRFERASGGMLFLDEIGDMSLALQSKILRAIQEREIERVGGTGPISVDVHVIAALNRDPAELVAQGRFRDDLYYRLAVVTVHLPRLADRDDDLFLLTSHFLREFGSQYGKEFTGVSENALDLLRRHEWVGNVRELRNVVERAALVADGPVIRPEHLPEEWRQAAAPNGPVTAPRTPQTLREVEARHIANVLNLTRGQIGEAARILGLHRNTLTRKIRQYRL
ncbi:MAG TPA: sigma-54 dependent transcriptional regulator [Candidatus Eisenbacteria bacterium]|nr:sigma-54 dependent transcriptional regulator [Candidatus Eisenbacteria bacterium]